MKYQVLVEWVVVDIYFAKINKYYFRYKQEIQRNCRCKLQCTIEANNSHSLGEFGSGTPNNVNVTWICINAVDFNGKILKTQKL